MKHTAKIPYSYNHERKKLMLADKHKLILDLAPSKKDELVESKNEVSIDGSDSI